MLSFIVSMSGFVFLIRIFQNIADNFGFSKQITRIFEFVIALLVFFIHFFFHQAPLLTWTSIGALFVGLKFLPEILYFSLILELKKRILPLMDQVILGLQSGQSFRTSLHQSIQQQPSWIRHQLLEIHHSIAMNQTILHSQNKFLRELTAEWSEMDKSQSKLIDHARAFRRQLKIEEDFRRKSGRVTQQMKMQAIIVTILYLALLIYVISQFGWVQNLLLIAVSAVLFSAGLAWIFMMGRKMKWKI